MFARLRRKRRSVVWRREVLMKNRGQNMQALTKRLG